MRIAFVSLLLAVFAVTAVPCYGQVAAPPSVPGRHLLGTTSTIDGTPQPFYLILPPGYNPSGPAVPLVVSLHSWRYDLEQRVTDAENEAARRGWLYLFPNFRGKNDHPEACGSLLAQQDILDALAWVRRTYKVDDKRIYLTGVSGGGTMTLLTAARHPEPWAAISAQVPISDLAAWHTVHANAEYGDLVRRCMGGAPGDSPAVDREYRERSPMTYITGLAGLPVDIAAGRHDGHNGNAVPIIHSLRAFNAIAAAVKADSLTDAEISQLIRPNGQLDAPKPLDTAPDSTYRRAIYLRRTAGASRITIFNGGHEGIASAAYGWFDSHRKP